MVVPRLQGNIEARTGPSNCTVAFFYYRAVIKNLTFLSKAVDLTFHELLSTRCPSFSNTLSKEICASFESSGSRQHCGAN